MASRGFRSTLLVVLLAATATGGYYYYQMQNVSAAETQHASERTAQIANDNTPEDAPDIIAITETFNKKDYASLESYITDIRKNDARTSSGMSRLSTCYSTLNNILEEMEQHKGMPAVKSALADWKKVSPNSQALRVASADFYMTAAWNARGGGYANTVRPEQWEVFDNLLKEAYATLSEAQKSEPYDPQVAASMLKLGMAAGMPKDAAKKIVDECIEKYPTYEPIYTHMAIYLLPRWQGEPGDNEKFMRYVQEKLPKPLGDVMFIRMARSINEYINHELFQQTSITYADLKPAFETLFATYPDGLRNKRAYADLVAMGDDLELSKKLFETTSGTWSAASIKDVWGNIEAFEQYKQWVTDKGDNPVFVTPLELAIRKDDYQAIKDAIANGADVNRTMSTGSRPIITAISDKHNAVVDLLLEHGADLKLLTRGGFSAVAATTNKDNVEVLQKIIDRGFKITDPVNKKNWNYLHMAAVNKAPKCLALALKQPGAKIDEATPDGWPPLFFAADKNAVECITLLLDAGANVNAKDKHLITALHHAAYTGAAESIKLLLARGADPNAASDCNITALDTAERNHQKEAAELLKKAMKSKKPV